MDALSSVLRLAHKYQIDAAVDLVGRYLEQHYPTDFNELLKHPKGAPGITELEHIGIVNIARLLACPAVLPTALMVCCTPAHRDLARGFTHEDGSRETLSAADLRRCVEGKVALMRQATSAFLLAFIPDPNAHWHAHCVEVMQLLLRHYAQQPGLLPHDSPFPKLAEYTDNFPEIYSRLCMSCAQLFTDLRRSARFQYTRRRSLLRFESVLHF